MPFIDHDRGRAYYRHWAAEDPRAAVVFLHGFGEHSGLYHRYGFALNAAGIDLWAVDQFGHGMTPGERGNFGSIEDSSALAEGLTELAEQAHPGIPLVAQGHSFGSIVTLFRLLAQPQRYRAGVISGAPLVPVAALLDSDSSFDLDPVWLSSDPFYLDALENDPLAFVDGNGTVLTRELDHAWDRFGAELPGLTVPTLAVHGEDDPIAMIGAVRLAAWCAELERVALPLKLDVLQPQWPGVPAVVDAVYCANMIHIAPWPCCAALMQGAARHLSPQGLLVTYGPYLEDDVPTAPGNTAFDADLRRRNPAWGLRRLADVAREAAQAGLVLQERVAMPANNLLLAWRRRAPSA